jgi:hypothetical protein
MFDFFLSCFIALRKQLEEDVERGQFVGWYRILFRTWVR